MRDRTLGRRFRDRVVDNCVARLVRHLEPAPRTPVPAPATPPPNRRCSVTLRPSRRSAGVECHG